MNNRRVFSLINCLLAFTMWSTLAIFFNRIDLAVSVYVVFGSLIGLCGVYLYFLLVNKNLPKITLSIPSISLFFLAAIKGIFWFRALQLYPVAKAMLIHNLAPIIAIVLAPVLIREKPHFNHFLAVITGFLGLSVLMQFNQANWQVFELGAIYALITALASGLQDVCQRQLSKSMSGLEQAFIFILGQALGSVLFLPNFAENLSWINLNQIVYFGLVGTAIPIILLSSSFKYLKSFEVATLGYSEPLLGALWGTLFLNQQILPSTAIGGLLIFLSGVTAIKDH